MDTLKAIEERRAMKQYDASFKIPDEHVRKIESLAVLSPTAFNIQNWRFLKVVSQEQRTRIREAAWNQAQVTDASLLYVLCGNLSSWKQDPVRYWKHANTDVQNWMKTNITNYYEGKPQVQRDEAMRSCGMAAQTLMLSAKALGYDSCPMDGFDFEKVATIINLPKDYVIAMFVVIGKSIQQPYPRGGAIEYSEAFTLDKFK